MEKNLLTRERFASLSFAFKSASWLTGVLLTACSLTAQTGYNVSSPVRISEIRKLELCDLPQRMVERIKHLSLSEMMKFKEEYQETIDDVSGEQVVKTVQLRYADNFIVGYIKTAPLLQSSNIVVSNVQIKVPVLWGCVPGVGHSEQHTAYSFADVKDLEAKESCVGWHQMAEGERLIPPTEKKKRKKLLGVL